MRKVLLPLVVVVALSAALVAWLWLSPESEAQRTGASAPAAALPSAPAAAPQTSLAAASAPAAQQADAAAAPSSRATVEQAQEEPERTAWRDGSEQWLEGRVSLDPATPRDEVLSVFAVERAVEAHMLYDDDGEGANVGLPGTRRHDDFVSEALVAADGSFRLALPAEAEVAHLALLGRYTYSPRTSEVRLPAAKPPVLAGELGAWITGQLSAKEGKLAGIEVELRPDLSGGFDAFGVGRQTWEPKSTSGPDGRFELRAVSTSVQHGLLARPDDHAALLANGIAVEAGEHLDRSFTLTAGATVRGRVLGPDGEPVEGAKVAAALPGILGRAIGSVREGTSDADGRYELPHVVPGKLEVRAEKDGFTTASARPEQALAEGEVREGLDLALERGRVLAGVVRYPDGAPAEGAKVEAGPDLARLGQMGGMSLATAGRGSAEADAEGRFEIGGLSQLAYKVVARASAAEGPRAGDWKAVAENQDGGQRIELVLAGVQPLVGRVVDVEGKPVTAFTVSARQDAGGSAGFFAGMDRRVQRFTDDEGRFSMKDLEAGKWQVAFEAKGFATTTLGDVVQPPPAEAGELVVTLERAAAIEGLVLDTGGRPAPGARVTVEQDLAARMASQGETPTAFADHEGRFHLELDPGEHAIVAELDGFAGSAPATCSTRSGEVTEDVVLTLRLGGTLTGVVLGDDGEPAVGRMVIVQRVPTYDAQKLLTSAADGGFRAEHLEPGQWQVVATVNFMSGESAGSDDANMNEFLGNMKIDMVDIVDGEETHVVLGEAAGAPVRVHGRVTAAGEPVGGALVSAIPEDGNGLKDLKMKPLGDDGRFDLDLPKAGNYLFTVQWNSGTGQQQNTELLQTIPPDVAEHTLAIELPAGRITGRVRGPGGDTLARCRVTLNSEDASYGTFMGGHFVEATTDDDGRYEIRYLEEGVYSVGAGGLGFGGLFGGQATGGRVVRGGLRLSEGETLDVDFRLEEPGELTGTVSDAAGQPVAEAVVFLRDEDGELVEHFSLIATDASGRFTYKGLSPGRYTASARAKELVSPESAPVRVSAGASSDVGLRLGTGTMLVVTVIDADEQELGTRLSVTDAAGHEYSSMRSMDEMMERMGAKFTGKDHRIGPVPPGTYTLVATAGDGRTTSKSVSISGQGERRVKLRLH